MKKSTAIIEKGANKISPAQHNLKEIVSVVFAMYNTIGADAVFINDVPEGLVLRNDKKMVQTVLKELVSSIVDNTPGRMIRIAAKVYTNIILLHIRKDGDEQAGIPENIKELQVLASRINGTVNITSCRANVTTFALAFPMHN